MTTPTLTELRTGMRMSVAEFMDWPEPDDKRKLELCHGELYLMPRPRPEHQRALAELCWHFGGYCRGFAEAPAEFYPDVIVDLFSDGSYLLSPDLAVILRGSAVRVTDTMVIGPPDIVVEILSSDRNRDLTLKRRLYAVAGAPEYWILDQRDHAALQLELRNGIYIARARPGPADALTTPLLPGLAIPLADLFRSRHL